MNLKQAKKLGKIQFNGPGSWPTMEQLAGFKPWNKRG